MRQHSSKIRAFKRKWKPERPSSQPNVSSLSLFNPQLQTQSAFVVILPDILYFLQKITTPLKKYFSYSVAKFIKESN